MKTKEELETIKKEYEELNNKLKELNEDELKKVIGGVFIDEKAKEEFNDTTHNAIE